MGRKSINEELVKKSSHDLVILKEEIERILKMREIADSSEYRVCYEVAANMLEAINNGESFPISEFIEKCKRLNVEIKLDEAKVILMKAGATLRERNIAVKVEPLKLMKKLYGSVLGD